MKLRKEFIGYHFFERETGLHLLVDEVIPKSNEYSIAPRTFSIALTNDCNTNCKFCHISKGKDYLEKQFVIDFCKSLDKLETFDIAFGGGEPLLHPDILEICQTIWDETSLGISITTNGHNLNKELIEKLSHCISFLRVSVDSVQEKKYKSIRNFDFSTLKRNLEYLKGVIPFGLNMVIEKDTINELDNVKLFAEQIGAEELLLLPQIENNNFIFNNSEWKKIENWIKINESSFPIRILEQARKKINIPVLFNNDNYYSDYLYLSADKMLMDSSYSNKGIHFELENLENILIEWRNAQLTTRGATNLG